MINSNTLKKIMFISVNIKQTEEIKAKIIFNKDFHNVINKYLI